MKRENTFFWVWLAGLTLYFVTIATFNLANFRPVSADESAIMDVSYNLATEGVLGSDLYADFYGAGTHFFINLPAHHLVQALAFKLVGAGVTQARLVSVLFAVGLIWLVGGLGVLTLLLLFGEGFAATIVDRRQAETASDYLAVGTIIADHLPAGAVVAGENQWWWALHEYTYRGIKVPFFRAQIDLKNSGQYASPANQIRADGIQYILLNNSFVGALFDTPPGFRRQYRQFLATCGRPVLTLVDATYGPIELYALHEACRN